MSELEGMDDLLVLSSLEDLAGNDRVFSGSVLDLASCSPACDEVHGVVVPLHPLGFGEGLPDPLLARCNYNYIAMLKLTHDFLLFRYCTSL